MAKTPDPETKTQQSQETSPDGESGATPRDGDRDQSVAQRGAARRADRAPETEGEGEAEAKQPLYRRPAFMIVAAIVLLLGAIFGIRYWLYARSHESTDDAFIDGRIIQVSPKITGYVVRVNITDNQQVKAGDLLLELDPRDYQARLDQAKAALDAGIAQEHEARTRINLTRGTTSAGVQQARAGVRQARSNVAGAQAAAAAERSRTTETSAAVATAQANAQQARAQLVAANAEAARAAEDVQRYQDLFNKDEVSRQRLDQAITDARTAAAQAQAAREKVASAEAQVNERRSAESAQASNATRAQTQVGAAEAQVSEAQGRLAQANTAPQQITVSEAQASTAGANLEGLRAAVAQAELDLSYTKIYATEAGRVTRKSVELGALVQPGQPLLALVPGDIWVT